MKSDTNSQLIVNYEIYLYMSGGVGYRIREGRCFDWCIAAKHGLRRGSTYSPSVSDVMQHVLTAIHGEEIFVDSGTL